MNNPQSHREYTLQFGTPASEVAFPRKEYQRRLEAVRGNMQRASVDLLYVTMPDHICYLSGYQAEWFQEGGPKSWTGLSGIAVHVDCDAYIHFENTEEKLLAQYTTHADDLRVLPEHGHAGGFGAWVVDELGNRGWLGGRAALELYSYRPNPADSAQLRGLLEARGCHVVDGTDLVAGARKLKSPLEMQAVREAARIGDIGLQAALDEIRPGMTELEVYAEIVCAMARAGGENPAITLPVVSGRKSACFHALSSRKQIEPGDIVNIDVCGVYKRYHSDVCRTVSMGEPSPQLADYIGSITGALPVAAGLLRPGLGVASFLNEMNRYYESCGLLENEWWIGGYELGIAFPPDWVGAYAFDLSRELGDETFEPGFVGNYEANFYLPQEAGLSALIDTMAFDEDSAGFLHRIPSRLFVVD